MKLPILFVCVVFIFVLQTIRAQADIDPAKLAPLTAAQVAQFKADFQDWKKKAKWDLVNPVAKLEILSDSTIRSIQLKAPAHALRLLYSEKQMKSTLSGNEVDSQGGALREIVGIESDDGFKILKDSGYFEPECGAEDFHDDLIQPVVLNKKALLAFTQTVDHLGCAGEESMQNKSLFLLDPNQKFQQLLEIPLLKKQESQTLMVATFSGWGGVGGGKDDTSSWYALRVERTVFKSPKAPAVHSHETYGWNKAGNQIELKKD